MKNQFVWTLWKLHSDPAPVVIRNTDTSISYTIKITFVIGTILQFYIHSFWFNKHSESDQWIAGGTASAQSRYTMSILSVSSCNYFIMCQQSTIIYILHLLCFSGSEHDWDPSSHRYYCLNLSDVWFCLRSLAKFEISSWKTLSTSPFQSTVFSDLKLAEDVRGVPEKQIDISIYLKFSSHYLSDFIDCK